MDKVKIALRWINKHRFWLSCGLIAIVGLASWYIATGSLGSERTTRVEELDGQFSKADAINGRGAQEGAPASGGVFHPNDVTRAETEKLINLLKQNVVEAWEKQYQNQGNLFEWPAELGPRFKEAVKDFRPIEHKAVYPPPPPTDPNSYEININFLTAYRNYIKQELPKLASIIGSTWNTGNSTGGLGMTGEQFQRPPGGMEGSGVPVEDKTVVHWSPENQQQLQSLFDWSTPTDTAGIPKTIQVLYAQEDLWVLKTLMNIIKATNGDADRNYNAAIKTIESIQIGRNAAGQAGTIVRLAGAVASGSESGGPGQAPYSPEGAGVTTGEGPIPSGTGEMDPSAQAVGFPDPADNRYVDNKYTPISGLKLRDRTSINPDDAYLSVAKRMPVRMRLVMDQRKLNLLLIECANSPLTVEIRQVRFNRPAATAAGGMQGAGFGEGGGGGFGQPPGMEGGQFRGGGSQPFSGGSGIGRTNQPQISFGEGGGSGGQSGTQSSFPYDVPIELYGIVYIYNPVDREKLIVKTDDLAQGEAAGTPAATPATPPAATPPAATPTPAPAPPAAVPVPPEPAPAPVVPAPVAPAAPAAPAGQPN